MKWKNMKGKKSLPKGTHTFAKPHSLNYICFFSIFSQSCSRNVAVAPASLGLSSLVGRCVNYAHKAGISQKPGNHMIPPAAVSSVRL